MTQRRGIREELADEGAPVGTLGVDPWGVVDQMGQQVGRLDSPLGIIDGGPVAETLPALVPRRDPSSTSRRTVAAQTLRYSPASRARLGGATDDTPLESIRRQFSMV